MSEPNSLPPQPAQAAAFLLEQALELHQRGELDEAQGLYQQVLTLTPEDFTAVHQLGVIRNQVGDFPAARVFLEKALGLHPRSALAHFNMGLALWNLGRAEEALAHYQYSLVLKPNNPDALLNCAVTLHGLQRFEEALARLDHLLLLPEHRREALLNRGLVLEALERPAEAVESFDRLLALEPQEAQAHLHRGHALLLLERPEEALASYDAGVALRPGWTDALLLRATLLIRLQQPLRALADLDRFLALEPNHADALNIRGDLLFAQHRPEEALACYDRSLALDPRNAGVWANRGNAFMNLGQAEEACASYDRALALRPDHADVLSNRSTALRNLNRLGEALEDCQRALALQPDNANAHSNLGTVFLDLKQPADGLASYQRALALDPANAEAYINQGTALHLLGRPREAIQSYDRALEIKPDYAAAASNKVFLLDYLPETGFVEHQRERARFYETQAQRFSGLGGSHPNDRNPERPLVLGYVSADFKHHSAAFCFGPVLKHHDKARFKVICYSGVVLEDEGTRDLRTVADGWRSTLGWSDDRLAAQIRADAVDILVDLSGHSKGNRLLVFARKPAPIQVTAWGHGGGTGLPMIDYQFTDPVFTPDWARPLFAEASFDLPCCITFSAPPLTPPVQALPARSKGYLTFGSLNRFSKTTPALLALWARLLQALPTARLLFKDSAFDAPALRQEVTALFSTHGIDPDRIEVRGITSRQKHLAAYNEVDLVLDTFPQNGGITTWEALWMGAPVVTRLGQSPASRISGAILHALGLGEWVCGTDADYLDLALRKAGDLEALARFRREIRPRIEASSAGNPELYTRAVEAAYRTLWHRWLAP